MPDYFSHAICAQKILEKLDKDTKSKIEDRTLYLLGAQGGDVFFAYKLNFKNTNLGRKLHLIDGERLFPVLMQGNLSYAAGFATHYALDCTLHPAVYAFEESSKSPMAHARFEADLGLYISRKYGIQRHILPRERVLSATFNLYDSIKRIEPEITVTGVERCLKRHFSYSRALLKSKRTSYAFDYDFSSLSTSVEDAVSLGAECVKAVISKDWSFGLFSTPFLSRQSNTLS